MNLICPKNGKICFSGCSKPCDAPEISKAAVSMADSVKLAHSPFLQKFSDMVEILSLETDLSEEAKMTINVQL